MVQGTATLVVDLGNSETRVRTYFGKTQKGKPRYRFRTLDNHYHKLSSDSSNLEERIANAEREIIEVLKNDAYSAENSSVFMLANHYYCNGLLCRKEYRGSVRPSAATYRKYEDIASKLAITNAFRVGYEMLSDIMNCEVSMIDVNWDVIILLPPEDMDLGVERISDMIMEIKEIDFVMPDIQRTIKINEGGIKVLPEGFCALIAVLFESKDKMRDEYSYLVQPDTTTLICDIGAGTTDLTITNGCNIVTSSRYTANIGGNNVSALLEQLLKKRSIRTTSERLSNAVQTGQVKVGARTLDISEDLKRSKGEIAQKLLNEINGFLERVDLPIQSIDNILVCGGGAADSVLEGVDSLGDYIVRFVRELSPYINVVQLPIVANEDGDYVKMPSRLLNITGAGILAE